MNRSKRQLDETNVKLYQTKRASILATIADCYLTAENYQAAIMWADEAFVIDQKNSNIPQMASDAGILALAHLLVGKHLKSIQIINSALLAIGEEASSENNSEGIFEAKGDLQNVLGDNFRMLGDYCKAISFASSEKKITLRDLKYFLLISAFSRTPYFSP